MPKRFFASLLALVLLLACLPVSANTSEPTRDLVEGIERCKGAESRQAWLDGELTENAGLGAEWYVLALIARDPSLDFTNYEAALRGRLTSGGITAPATELKCALVLACLGSSPDLVGETLEQAIGRYDQLMAWVFGLHLLNAGYIAAEHTADEVIERILSRRNEDGGWSVTGSVSDVDVTAMTLQALAPNREKTGVAQATDTALALLASRQLESGGFESYGVENAESSAQVLLALSCLSVPAETAGFEGGYDRLLAGLTQFATESGGFSHQIGGDVNELATSQVYLALSATLASRAGKPSVFLPDAEPGSFVPTARNALTIFLVALACLVALFVAIYFVLRSRQRRGAEAS